MRPDYFIFVGYLEMGGWEGGSSKPPEPPLDPPLKCWALSEFQMTLYWYS